MCNIYICIRQSKEEKKDTLEIENTISTSLVSNNWANLNLYFITERKEIPENEIIKMKRTGCKKSAPKNNRHTKDDISPFIDLVKKYLEEKMSIMEISKRLKVNYSSLYTFIRNENLRKQKKHTPQHLKKDWPKATTRKFKLDPYLNLIIEDLKKGKKPVDMARQNGWEPSTLNSYIRRHGLRTEGKGKMRAEYLRKTKQDDIPQYLGQIKKYLREDMTIMEISKRLKVNYSTLYKFIQTENLRKQRLKKDWSKVKIRPKKSKLDLYRNLIIEDLKNGKKPIDIARENGWGASTLNYYIRRHGLKTKAQAITPGQSLS